MAGAFAAALSEHMLPVSPSFGAVFVAVSYRNGVSRYRLSLAVVRSSVTTEILPSNCESSRLVNITIITHVRSTILKLVVVGARTTQFIADLTYLKNNNIILQI